MSNKRRMKGIAAELMAAGQYAERLKGEKSRFMTEEQKAHQRAYFAEYRKQNQEKLKAYHAERYRKKNIKSAESATNFVQPRRQLQED